MEPLDLAKLREQWRKYYDDARYCQHNSLARCQNCSYSELSRITGVYFEPLLALCERMTADISAKEGQQFLVDMMEPPDEIDNETTMLQDCIFAIHRLLSRRMAEKEPT